ncbi:MAG: hypothetical protein H6815_01610 [Phycisphaeraceae bacterium]|nr:hypothetical protein [Phycisphaerales bacterium]MCB9859124.1 hypothetical protein [Phycisphaeraceae bacterium]
MTIDPLLYEKLSGKQGDPQKRLGEALSQHAKRSAETKELRGDGHPVAEGIKQGRVRSTLFGGLRRLFHM